MAKGNDYAHTPKNYNPICTTVLRVPDTPCIFKVVVSSRENRYSLKLVWFVSRLLGRPPPMPLTTTFTRCYAIGVREQKAVALGAHAKSMRFISRVIMCFIESPATGSPFVYLHQGFKDVVNMVNYQAYLQGSKYCQANVVL